MDAAIAEGAKDEEFENMVATVYSKSKALELMRKRRVVGMCSQDNSPRIHAQNIAVLAAEAVEWEVFLRAHLNIMNDRFDRLTDGSYAWAKRKTYIRELEELDINILDLLIGTALVVDNPAPNHYYGSIGRIGRALSETQQTETFENRMMDMLRDEELDENNRTRLYWLYLNYLHHLEDTDEMKQKLFQFKNYADELPDYMSEHLKAYEIE